MSTTAPPAVPAVSPPVVPLLDMLALSSDVRRAFDAPPDTSSLDRHRDAVALDATDEDTSAPLHVGMCVRPECPQIACMAFRANREARA